MSENSICNCCYNKCNLIKKCDYEHHQVCTCCIKEYSLRFGRKNCMYCDPQEERKDLQCSPVRPVYYDRRMSNNNLYFILFCNIFLSITMIGILFLILTLIVNISLTLKDVITSHNFLDIYYTNHCNIMEMQNMNFDQSIYCNL